MPGAESTGPRPPLPLARLSRLHHTLSAFRLASLASAAYIRLPACLPASLRLLCSRCFLQLSLSTLSSSCFLRLSVCTVHALPRVRYFFSWLTIPMALDARERAVSYLLLTRLHLLFRYSGASYLAFGCILFHASVHLRHWCNVTCDFVHFLVTCMKALVSM